jgi:hypothetical protein
LKTGYAIGRAAKNTFLVRERDLRRWRDLGLVLLVIVPLGAALLAYAWVHLEVAETGYRIAELEAELDGLLETQRHEQVHVARLLGPERLEGLAAAHELQEPSWAQLLFVEKETVSLPPSALGPSGMTATPAALAESAQVAVLGPGPQREVRP